MKSVFGLCPGNEGERNVRDDDERDLVALPGGPELWVKFSANTCHSTACVAMLHRPPPIGSPCRS